MPALVSVLASQLACEPASSPGSQSATAQDPPAARRRIERPAAPAIDDRPNLVMVSIDTLRADRVGAYGHDLATSPRLDRMAAEGVFFGRAYSHSSKTAPSHMTLMTGLYSEAHRVLNLFSPFKRKDARGMSPEISLLAEILREAGYATAASTAGGNISGDLWRVSGGRYDRLYKEFFRRVDLDDANVIQHLLDLYDACVRYVDDQLGALLDRIEELGVAEDTVVIILSDHGEEFGEHGGFEHNALWEELLRVPLVMHVPEWVRSGWSGRHVENVVGLVDVLPTLRPDKVGAAEQRIRRATADSREYWAQTGEGEPLRSAPELEEQLKALGYLDEAAPQPRPTGAARQLLHRKDM